MNEILTIDNLVALWILIVGLCIGSFLNVVILRGLSGESIVFPPSKCPACNNKLKWWMNIPVLSYLLLKGKCGYCKNPISIQYPIVEFITGLFFLLIFLNFSYSTDTIFYLIAISLLMVMSVCDIKESVIFDIHAYILIVAGLLFNTFTGTLDGFLFSITGAISGFILYEIIARTGYLFAGQRAFGEGDSLIAAGIGAFFGWKMMILSILISVFVMAIFTFPYFLFHSYKTGKKRTVTALILSVFLIIAAYIISKFELIKTFYSSLIFLFVILGSVLWCAKQILSDLNKKDENGEKTPCMLPFGPAMAISFVVIMFFEENLKTLLLQYFS